jgi:hypothetical protein
MSLRHFLRMSYAFLIVAILSAPAWAGWSPPLPVDDAGDGYYEVGARAALDDDGKAVAVWRSPQAIFSVGDLEGNWIAPQPVAESAFQPDVASNGAGTWVMVYQADADTGLNQRTDIKYRRTTDSGVSWTTGTVAGNPVTSFNPRVATNGSGTWVTTWHRGMNEVVVSRSTDDGATWGSPQVLTSGAADWAGAPAVAMAPNNTCIVAWAAVVATPPAANVVCARSPDGGETWSLPTVVATDAAFGSLSPVDASVTRGGTWMISTLLYEPGHINRAMVIASVDGGTSWTEPAIMGESAVPGRLSSGYGGQAGFIYGWLTHFTRTNDGVEWLPHTQLYSGVPRASSTEALATNRRGDWLALLTFQDMFERDLYFTTATTSMLRAFDLQVSMAAAPSPAPSKSVVRYTATVHNTGPDTAEAVRLIDTLPWAGTLVEAFAVPGTETSYAGRVVYAEFGNLAAGETVTLVCDVLAPWVTGPWCVSPSGRPVSCSMGNNAEVICHDPFRGESNPNNNVGVISVNVDSASADLELLPVVCPASVHEGATFTFKLHARNNGPSIADGVVLGAVLPDECTYAGATVSQGTVTATSGTVTALVGRVGVDEDVAAEISVRANAVGSAVLDAWVTGVDDDPTSSNNGQVAVVEVQPGVAADLVVQWLRLRRATVRTRRGHAQILQGVVAVRNSGNTASSRAGVRFYLSDDPYLDEGADQLLRSAFTDPMRPHNRQLIGLNARLAPGTSAAGKYVIAIVDPAGEIDEINESNNDAVRQVP